MNAVLRLGAVVLALACAAVGIWVVWEQQKSEELNKLERNGSNVGRGDVHPQAKADELSEEVRIRLEKEALALSKRAVELYQRGQYIEATRLLEDALGMNLKLYPAARFPDGHPYLAKSMSNLGSLLQARGEYAQALPYYRDALAMFGKLYPAARFPDGHPTLAISLNNVGGLHKARGDYTHAEPYYRDALAMTRKLYPAARYPDGHPNLALSLINLGTLLLARGEYAPAEPYLRDALVMYRQLYPAARYPDGHPHLANSLNSLGGLLQDRGEYGQAEPYCRDALAMYRKLYPAAHYPDGHPDLALSLNNLGALVQYRGEFTQAESYYRDALAMRCKLYPAARYPDGHPNLAISLNNLGSLLQALGEYAYAEPYLRDALAMRCKLYPAARYPDGHPHLAISLNNLGSLLQARGAYAQAEPYCRDALGMRRKLYAETRYPDGHPHLASSLNNLAGLLQTRGEYAQAEPYYREALAMMRKLYPAARYPDGHPNLATCLNNLGLLHRMRGEYAQAEPYYRDALAMFRTLYPTGRYPDGHPDLANTRGNLGNLLQERGYYAQAEPYFRDGLAMCRKLYPAARYPDGHPHLAKSLHNLGVLLQDRGEYAQAEPYFRDALAMDRKLYPAARYPDGHPNLAGSLNNLGCLLQDRAEYAQAELYCRDALAMSQRLAATFADASAEAEALNYLTSQLPWLRENFLSVTCNVKDSPPDTTYALLWQGKAALARALERRQRLLRQLDDVTVRDQLKELLDTRRELAHLLLSLDRQEKGRDQRLQTLTLRKEDLEKKLAARLPEVKDAQPPYSDLVDRLAADAAFIDFHRYNHRPRGEKEWRPHYVAFVLRKGAKVVRVELGQAEPIEKALAAWCQAIAERLGSPAAADLRRLVWDKLAVYLPEQPGSTLYLCPDSDLSALPWAALPGRRPGTVLLEDHTLALVPHGQFLLARLRERGQARPPGPGVLLAVGGVSYDKGATPVRRPDALADLRRADRADQQGAWPDLPGSAREAKAVAELALARREPPKVLARDGTEAGPGQLLLDLPQARWAHLATHGFFAAPASGVRKYLIDEKDFLRGMKGERVGVGARNPLTQTGLVLAGANLKDKAAAADGGILTAEGLAGLNLDQLELAVLSACETGLGEASSGEGVFGLQRAFHLGGCKNVVASLWKVDDDATAALMAVFYHELWVNGAPPLQALRRAQLALYRHPQDVTVLARSRGPDFDTTVRRVTQPPRTKGPRPQGRAAVKDWAAFVLSGAGN